MPGRTFLHLNEKVNPMSLVNFFKTESKCVFVLAVIIDDVTDADDVTGAEAQSRLLQLVDRAVMRVRWRRLLLLWSGTGDRIEELRFEPLYCSSLYRPHHRYVWPLNKRYRLYTTKVRLGLYSEGLLNTFFHGSDTIRLNFQRLPTKAAASDECGDFAKDSNLGWAAANLRSAPGMPELSIDA